MKSFLILKDLRRLNMYSKVIRVFDINDYEKTIFIQVIDDRDLETDGFKRELISKGLEWEEYYE